MTTLNFTPGRFFIANSVLDRELFMCGRQLSLLLQQGRARPRPPHNEQKAIQ